MTQFLIEEAAYLTLDTEDVNARLAALDRAESKPDLEAERTARLVAMAKRAQGKAA